ncbi:Glutathione S transferase T3 [Carabus blaptoides fortunei]
MTLKLYYDLLSQPSRAVYIFLKAAKVPFEPKDVPLRKNAHFTDDFKQISRFNLVPAIEHDGFKLVESVAILRYLVRAGQVADHWFPKDSRKQAKVDEYLAWQHHNTRFLCNFYFQRKYLTPIRTGVPMKEEHIQDSEDRLVGCLEKIENMWLDKQKFLAGDDITVADILAACELEQTRIAGFDPRDGFPKIRSWLDAVRDRLNPHYDEAHSVVYRLIEKNQVNSSKST